MDFAYLQVDPVVFKSVQRLQPRGVKVYCFTFREGREYKQIPVGTGLMPTDDYTRLTQHMPPNIVIVVDELAEGKNIDNRDKIVFVCANPESQALFLEALETYTGVKSWQMNSF